VAEVVEEVHLLVVVQAIQAIQDMDMEGMDMEDMEQIIMEDVHIVVNKDAMEVQILIV
jgi:hypothetical protein